MKTISEQIKHEADKTMRELEQSGLSPFQIDRLSGKVNGLMLAYEIAQTAHPMPTCEDCGDGLTAGNAGVCANCLPAYRAKREPLTAERVKTLMMEAGYGLVTPQEQADFLNGMRHAEIAHGITKGSK